MQILLEAPEFSGLYAICCLVLLFLSTWFRWLARVKVLMWIWSAVLSVMFNSRPFSGRGVRIGLSDAAIRLSWRKWFKELRDGPLLHVSLLSSTHVHSGQ
jgi:hypothetical protein